jgi:hypothetical protein
MTHQQPSGGPASAYAISLIRTVVPLAWGLLVSWLISLGLPAAVLATYHDVIVAGLTSVVTAGWYAGWRWAETKIPQLDSMAAGLAVALALGHAAAPSYGTVVPAPDNVVLPPGPATPSATRPPSGPPGH